VALMHSGDDSAVTNGNRSSPDAIKFLDARGANFGRKVWFFFVLSVCVVQRCDGQRVPRATTKLPGELRDALARKGEIYEGE